MRKLTAFGICIFVCGLLWMFVNQGVMPMISPYIITNKFTTLQLVVWHSFPYIVMVIGIVSLLVNAKTTSIGGESD